MLSCPAVAAMYPFVPVSITPDGFPRSLPDPWEQEDDRSQWTVARYGEGAPRRAPHRSSTPHSHTLSLTSSPSSGGSLSRRPSLRGPGAEASKRPPRDWRSDFSMNGPGLLGNFLTRSRSKSSVSGGVRYYLYLFPTPHTDSTARHDRLPAAEGDAKRVHPLCLEQAPVRYDLRREALTRSASARSSTTSPAGTLPGSPASRHCSICVSYTLLESRNEQRAAVDVHRPRLCTCSPVTPRVSPKEGPIRTRATLRIPARCRTHLESPAPTPVSRPPLGAHVVDGLEILLE